MRAPNRRREPGSDELVWLVGGGAFVGAFLLWCAAWLAARWADRQTAGDPFTYGAGFLSGDSRWPGGASGRFVILLLPLAGMLVVLGWLFARSIRGRTRVDDRAASMAAARDQRELEAPAMRREAAQLGAQCVHCGLPLGRSVRNGRELYSSLQWVQLWIMGPRAGKTSCVCVPQVLEADGPVLATSNKRDLVDLTRGPRSEVGAVWINDPQGLIGEPASWWWNPLTFVTSLVRADQLVSLFVAASRPDNVKADAYFDPAGRDAFASLLLAAAVADRPITQVYLWLTDPDDTEPARILYAAGHDLPARAYEAAQRLTPKQRDGIFGTALQMTAFLRNADVLPWITPQGQADRRPQFDPDAFVRSKHTLYLVSREGAGSARALTAALTVAVVEAAEQHAMTQRGGRLAVPMTVVLDEAANVCRWPELPDLYTHYGSRGILMSTFLQAWSQGVQVWGREGMDKMWSAANVRGVGRGIADPDFLDKVSRLVGDRDVITRDRSRSRSGVSVSTRNRRERILDTADLAAMPQGRATLLVSGLPALLLRLVHWGEKPYGASCAASQKHYEEASMARSRS
jgi:type IV secretory pathway TraG/TraD family ATPase VirD4